MKQLEQAPCPKCALALLIFLTLASLLTAQTVDVNPNRYRMTKTKATGIGVVMLGSLVDGVLEGYGFDGRKSFERKYGVAPDSYFGSQSWKNPHTWMDQNFGKQDFYHHADDLRKLSYISGGITIGLGMRSNKKWWHYGIDIGATLFASALAKKAGLEWVRR